MPFSVEMMPLKKNRPASSAAIIMNSLQLQPPSNRPVQQSAPAVVDETYLNKQNRKVAIDAIHRLINQLDPLVKNHRAINQWRRFRADNAELAYNTKFESHWFNDLRSNITTYPEEAITLFRQIDSQINMHNLKIKQHKSQFDQLSLDNIKHADEVQRKLNDEREARENPLLRSMNKRFKMG